MFPENVSRSEYKCVRYLSVELVLTDFWHIWKSDTDSFLTQFLVLPHFWDISNSNLTDFLQILESDSFLTHIQHISDSFLTYFCNWHISDSFQTVFWQINEIGGTYKSKEYRKYQPGHATTCWPITPKSQRTWPWWRVSESSCTFWHAM